MITVDELADGFNIRRVTNVVIRGKEVQTDIYYLTYLSKADGWTRGMVEKIAEIVEKV